MRRRSVLVRLYQEAELCLYLLVGKTQRAEHVLLKLAVGYSHRAGKKLYAVHYKVIALCPHVRGVGVKVFKAFVQRHGERVVHRVPASGLLVILKERELDYPQKVVLVGGDDVHLLGCYQPERAESGQNDIVFVRHDEHHVALLGTEAVYYRVKLSVLEELREGAGRLVLHPADIRQSLCAYSLGVLGELVYFLSRVDPCAVLDDYRPYRAARLYRRAEHYKINILDRFGDVLNLHAEACVRLVRAVAVHGVGIGQPREREGYILSHYLLEEPLHQSLAYLQDVLDIDKGHLHVYLCKLRLPVRSEVLVPEAACELDIAVKAGDHQKLLVYLGRLRQSVELAVVYSRGNEIVPRALRGGAYHHRGLYLDEVVVIEVLSCDLGDFMPEEKIFGELFRPEVKVAVSELELIVDLVRVGYLKGGGLSLCENAKVCHSYLDRSGSDFGVYTFSGSDHALCHKHILVSDRSRLLKNLPVGVVSEGELHYAGSVPKIYKYEVSEVPYLLSEAAYHHLAGGKRDLGTVVSPSEVIHSVHISSSDLIHILFSPSPSVSDSRFSSSPSVSKVSFIISETNAVLKASSDASV